MKVYILTEKGSEYNDEYYSLHENGNGDPVKVFGKKINAEIALEEFSRKSILDLDFMAWGYDMDYGEDALIKDLNENFKLKGENKLVPGSYALSAAAHMFGGKGFKFIEERYEISSDEWIQLVKTHVNEHYLSAYSIVELELEDDAVDG